MDDKPDNESLAEAIRGEAERFKQRDRPPPRSEHELAEEGAREARRELTDKDEDPE